MAIRMPPLRQISLTNILQLSTIPTLKIRTDDDVKYWKMSRSYQDYMNFLRRLNESVVGYFLPWNPQSHSKSVERIMTLLETLNNWIDDIPPLETPQRFGNTAFRTWGQRLEERSEFILANFLGPDFKLLLPYVKPYFMSSFGSFSRMDYGTGHETSFALFLLCLTLVRFFQPVEEEERDLVLTVFLRYLRLCWRLQDTYKLEPAGSHGVWGLDDYTFLSYIFGSGQLRVQTEIPVSAVLQPPLPPTNLYFMSIMRIHDVKSGPFFEHSSQLYSIAAGVPNWGKVNSGLFKMYDAEVLGKRVVVQHIPLGGILEWEETAETSVSNTNLPQEQVMTGMSRTHAIVPTTAPWVPPSSYTTVAVQPKNPGLSMAPPPLPGSRTIHLNQSSDPSSTSTSRSLGRADLQR